MWKSVDELVAWWDAPENIGKPEMQECVRLLSLPTEELEEHIMRLEDFKFDDVKTDSEESSHEEEGRAHVTITEEDGGPSFSYASNSREQPRSSRSRNTSNRSSGSRGSYSRYQPYATARPDTQADVLYIDCILDREKEIDRWQTMMKLIIENNRDVYSNLDTTLQLFKDQTSGIVKDFLEHTDLTPLMGPNRSNSVEDYFRHMVNAIYTTFIGKDYFNRAAETVEQEREAAKAKLIRMSMCDNDLCNFESFTCEYEKSFYKIAPANRPKFAKSYIRKLPGISEQVMKKFLQESAIAQQGMGVAIKNAREVLAEYCRQRKMKKMTKNIKLCCDDIWGVDGDYSCKVRAYKKKKKKYSSKKEKYKRKYKRKYRMYSGKKKYRKKYAGRYYKRRKDIREDVTGEKKKFCPAQKKDCKCWLCHEEGHYANACPQRHKHGVKAMIAEQGFEPCSTWEGKERIFLLARSDFEPESDWEPYQSYSETDSDDSTSESSEDESDS